MQIPSSSQINSINQLSSRDVIFEIDFKQVFSVLVVILIPSQQTAPRNFFVTTTYADLFRMQIWQCFKTSLSTRCRQNNSITTSLNRSLWFTDVGRYSSFSSEFQIHFHFRYWCGFHKLVYIQQFFIKHLLQFPNYDIIDRPNAIFPLAPIFSPYQKRYQMHQKPVFLHQIF